MSDAKAEEAAPPAPAGPSKIPLLLALVNTVAVLAGVGTLYYTKIMFKRPEITEELERKRLEAAHAKKTISEATAPGLIAFDPVTVNIESYPAPPATPPDEEGPAPIKGKLHYVTMAFSAEIVDGGQKPAIEQVKPVIMDQILTLMAHKPVHELATVQGRYVLRTQIMEMLNRLTEELPSHPPLLASAVAKASEKGHGEGGHGEGGEGGEHGAAPPAEGGEHGGGGEHGEGGEHGGGEHGGGEHGAEAAKKPPQPEGPPIKSLYRDGMVSNVYFTQFIVQ